MRAILQVDPTEAVPIWKQIEAGLRRLVLAQQLDPGAPVPSVRELARDLQVNPATVAKAYQRLVEAGLLEVRRGEGTFVAVAAPATRSAGRETLLREGAHHYAALGLGVGAGLAEAILTLEAAWKALQPSQPGAPR